MISTRVHPLAFLAVLALAGSLVVLARGGADAPDGSPTAASVALAGYPPPASATPPATPTADPRGYLPPPTALPWAPVQLVAGPHAELLVSLQDAIDGGDASWPAARVADDRAGMLLAPALGLDAEGGLGLLASGAESLLADYLAAGDPPRIQGYFEQGDCLELILHRLPGPVAHPPTPVSETGQRFGPAAPDRIEAESAAWRFCRAGEGIWLWDRWAYGDYDELLAWGNGSLAPPGATYQVLRP